MFATLIAVLVALATGHLAPVLTRRLRDHAWFARWLLWLDARLPASDLWRGGAGGFIVLLPPLLLLAAVQLACAQRLHGLPTLLLGICVLFYAWGPRDLDLDVDAVLNADDPVARRVAAGALWPAGKRVSLVASALIDATVRGALRRWFGVLLWFLLLGPVGALLYRLAALTGESADGQSLPPDNAAGARTLLAVLDWPAAQLMTVAMALVGHFDGVVDAWRRYGGAGLSIEAAWLGVAARASVRRERVYDFEDETDDGHVPELRDAMRLVWRILLLWLAAVAVLVLAGWVA